MTHVVLSDVSNGSEASIAIDRGFNCYQFQTVVDGRKVEVIDAPSDFALAEHRPSAHGIPVLFPFPNRIRDGRFSWREKQYAMTPDDVVFDSTGNAIHGFCLDRPWRVVAQDEQFVVGQFQLSVDAPERLKLWPADFLIELRYTLKGPVLRADVRIVNPDKEPLPWGFGTHPYFRLPLDAQSSPQHCLIEAPAAQEWELISCLPTGARKPVSPEKDLREGAYFTTLKLDDVLTGLKPARGRVESLIMDETGGLQVTQSFDPLFRELVVYTPASRNAVCLEPYTCATDAINLEARGVNAGLAILEPGQERRTWIEIAAGLILV